MSTEPPDITTLLHERAAELGDKAALCFLADGVNVRESLSYRALADRTRALAGTLAASFAPGERVLLMLPSSLDFVRAFLACCEARLIAVPVFPAPTRRPRYVDRLQGIALSARPALMLCAPAAREATEAFSSELGIACRVACLEDFEAVALAAPRSRSLAADGDAGIAFLQYTSGSTSAPKGVVVGHASLIANLRAAAEHYGWSSTDTRVSWLPLFHDMGLIGGVLMPLYCGMTIYLMATESFIRSPRRWLEAISHFRATSTPAPDFAYALCARTLADACVRQLDLSCLVHAISGGEPIQPATLRAFARKFAGAGFDPNAFASSYGQAEATLCVSARVSGSASAMIRLDRAAASERRVRVVGSDEPRQLVLQPSAAVTGGPSAVLELASCGRLVPDLEAAIVDPASRARCGSDRIGELWLRGSSVALGYFEDRAASEATFAATIDGEPAGSSWLRTGDLAFLHDGELVLCGRLKDTMIVGGRNVYPHDLEFAAARAGGLRAGRIVAVSEYDAALGREALWLIAEPERRRTTEPETLQLFAAVQAAALEACDVALDRIVLVKPGTVPLTTSGKLSRRATKRMLESGELTIVADTAQQRTAANLAPSAPTEAACLACFSRLFAQLRPGVPLRPEQTLIEHGCDSLALVALQSALDELGYRPSLADLFGDKTVAALVSGWATQLQTQPPSAAFEAPLPESVRAPAHDAHPLSRAQQRLWFLHELAPERCDHNLVVRLELRGPLDRDALQVALDWLVERHAVLRTRYRTLPAGPEAIPGPPSGLSMAVEDLTAAMPRERTLRRAITGEQCKPFVLRHAPAAPSPPAAAIRARLYRSSGALHDLILTVHHIAFDGRSAETLVRDLERAYRAARRGVPLPPANGPQYSDFARAEHAAFDGSADARALAFFSDYLADLPALSLPRSGVASGDRQVRFSISPRHVETIVHLAQAERASLFIVSSAAFALVVRHLTGCERFAIGTDVAGRQAPSSRGLVGFFVNQLALRCDVSGEPSLRALIARQRQNALSAYAHDQLAFDRLVGAAGSDAPVFQLKLNYQPQYLTRSELADLALTIEVHQSRAEFPLVVDLVAAADGGIDAALEYDAALSPRFVTRLEQLWRRLMSELELHLDRPLPVLLQQLAAWEIEHDAREAGAARERLGISRRRAITPGRSPAEEP